MEIARTSLTHAHAPNFLWPYAVWYAAHKLNFWPRVSWPGVSLSSLWTGSPDVASRFCAWGCLARVRDNSADKLSPRALPCVFLGLSDDSSDLTFYHPPLHRFLDSSDVRFDESVPYYTWYPCQGLPVPPPPLFLTPNPPPAPLVQPPPPELSLGVRLLRLGVQVRPLMDLESMGLAALLPAVLALGVVLWRVVGAAAAGATAAGGVAATAARAAAAAAAVRAAAAVAVAAYTSCLWPTGSWSPLPISSLLPLSSCLRLLALLVLVLRPLFPSLTVELSCFVLSPLVRLCLYFLLPLSRPLPLPSTPIIDYYRTYHPVLSPVLASLLTDPRASLSSVSALTATITEFAATRRLDYATRIVAAPPTSPLAVRGESALGYGALEDRQFELELQAAASPHLCAMLFAPEGDPNALDIPTPRTYAEAVSGPWAS
ncbi:unnamed protein product [Closterium sp. NIES-54]